LTIKIQTIGGTIPMKRGDLNQELCDDESEEKRGRRRRRVEDLEKCM